MREQYEGEKKIEKIYDVLTTRLGGSFSRALGIELESLSEEEIFKWFLASILYGAPIRESSATKTFHVFMREGLITPRLILKKGWDGLVSLLDEGGYTRYDFKTATKLIEMSKNLIRRYGGSLSALHESSADSEDLKSRIMDLAKGIGAGTAEIFLREMRGIWKKANPPLSSLACLSAFKLGLLEKLPSSEEDRKGARDEIMEAWSEMGRSIREFVELESSLVRLGKGYCRKDRCNSCPVRELCKGG